MKESSPRKLALFSAMIVSLTMMVLLTLQYLLAGYFQQWIILLAGTSFVFLLSYVLFKYILNRFIYDKIRLIYKTIRDLKAPKGKRRENIFSERDLISLANEEVAAWASDKTKEIEDLKKLEAYRREFLGNVSHELKTPIFNIQGYVLTLLDGGLDDPQVNRHYLMRSEQSINRMISIVEDLETISRLESGEVQLNYVHFDMVKLAREVMDLMEREATHKKITMIFGRNYDAPVMVYADRQNIFQVMTNLIANALKYGTENGRVKLSFFDMDEHILTEVTDSGVGIPREEIPRVFERFYRGEKSRTRKQGGGSGLGLSIVKHVLEAHNQTINVRSKPGVGSTFAFTLKKGKPQSQGTLLML